MSIEHFDAVVVGSGFGGSVMSYRLVSAGMRVCVLERGQAFPPGAFPRTPEGMHRIYANVLLRKDEKWFVREDPTKPGQEYWPVSRQDLNPHYDRVERMMNAQRYPFDKAPYHRTEKTRAMQMAAGKLNLEWMLPPLAVTFSNDGEEPVPGEPIKEEFRNLHNRTRSTCRLCGECDIGCNYGSKNTLDYNYLSAAKRAGADIRTLCEVERFEPRAGGGYLIHYRKHNPAVPVDRTAGRITVSADRLVLAAGTLGTTYLLLKNRNALPALSPTLGSRFCGNGDLLTFALRCETETNGKVQPWPVDGTRGPVITSAIRMPDAADGKEGRGFYIEDAGYPAFVAWLLEATGAMGTFRRAKRVLGARIKAALGIRKDTNFSAELSTIIGAAELSSTSLPLLGMGRDVADGRLKLEGNLLESDWTISRSSSYFKRMRETMHNIAKSWGAGFRDNAIWHLGRRVITVHPLGGAPMGRNASEGVVDEQGEVFGYPDLYVADGAMMPGPVGANPALTIAALADRFADGIVERYQAGLVSRVEIPAAEAV
mgnify:FL=1